MTQPFAYPDATVTCHGDLAVPAGSARAPGIAVFANIGGVGDHTRRWADRIADELGYLALAADTYGEGAVPDGFPQGMAWIETWRKDTPGLVARGRAALTALAAHPRCDGRLAAIGFCFGGAVVLELARAGTPGMAAGVSFHGALQTTTRVGLGGIPAKLLVCHGAEDPLVDYAALTAFLAEMRDADADCQTLAFSGVVHAFTNAAQDGSMSPALKFNAAADRRSWRAMAAHFAEVFG